MGGKLELIVTGTDAQTARGLRTCLDLSRNVLFPDDTSHILVAHGDAAVDAAAEAFQRRRKDMIFGDGRVSCREIVTGAEPFDFERFGQTLSEFLEHEGLGDEDDGRFAPATAASSEMTAGMKMFLASI